jgi:DNA-binding transcriptional regulator YdaS (Cro superfamily)
MDESLLKQAIEFLGGPTAAAAVLKRKQPTISGYVASGNVPADVCMRIELATAGRFTAEQLRPDLADVFAGFRRGVAAPETIAAAGEAA